MNRPHVIVFITAMALTGAVFYTGCDKPATAGDMSATPASGSLSLDEQAAVQVREHFGTMWVNRGELWYGVSGTGGPESMIPRSLIEAKGVSFHPRSSGPLSEADRLNQLEWSGEVNVTATASRRKPLQPGAGWKDWETGLELYNGDGATTYALEKKAGRWRIVKPGCEVERPAPQDLIMPGSKEEKEYLIQQAEKRRAADQRANEATQRISAEAPKLLIGTWRYEKSVSTFLADGTMVGKYNDGLSTKAEWKLDGDILEYTIFERNGKRVSSPKTYRTRLIEITSSLLKTKDVGDGDQEWRATRVK